MGQSHRRLILSIVVVAILAFAGGICACLLLQSEGLKWEYIHYSVIARVSTESKPYTIGQLVEFLNNRDYDQVAPEPAAELLNKATGYYNFKLQCATDPGKKNGEICVNYVCRSGSLHPVSFSEAYSEENKAKTAYVGEPDVSEYGTSSWLAYNDIFCLVAAMNLGGVFTRVELMGQDDHRAYDDWSWLCMRLYELQLSSNTVENADDESK